MPEDRPSAPDRLGPAASLLPTPASRPAPDGLLARALHVEWGGFSVVSGVIAAVLLAGIVWAARQFGQPGLFAGMGVMQALMAAFGAPPSLRPKVAALFAALGAAATGLAALVVADMAAGLLAVGAVSLAAGLCGAFGPGVGRVGNALAIWFVLAISLVDVRFDPAYPVLGFLGGGLVVSLLAASFARATDEEAHERGALQHARERLWWPSPVVRFAVVFAAGSMAAWALGEMLVPRHVAWPAMTAMLLVRPDATGSLVAMLQRLGGTLVGAMAAVAIIGRISDPRLLVVLLLASAFGVAATLKVNYAIFATCMTVLVVSLASLLGDDPAQASNDRLLATALGAAIALVAMAVLRIWGLAMEARPGRHAAELA